MQLESRSSRAPVHPPASIVPPEPVLTTAVDELVAECGDGGARVALVLWAVRCCRDSLPWLMFGPASFRARELGDCITTAEFCQSHLPLEMSDSKRKRTRAPGAAAAAASAAPDDGKGGKEGEGSGGGGKGRPAVRLPLAEIRAGDILSQTQYMKILEVAGDRRSFRAEILRSAKPAEQGADEWTISTPFDFQACSAAHHVTTEKLSKTEMARRLMSANADVFTITFRPTLTAELLADKLKEHQAALGEAHTEAAFKKIAKQLLAVEPKTMRARLLEANNALGYSLVDCLDDGADSRRVAFRNINHRDIAEIVTGDVRYVLK